MASNHKEIRVCHAAWMRGESRELDLCPPSRAISVVIQGTTGAVVDDPIISVARRRAGVKGGRGQRPRASQRGEDRIVEPDRVVGGREVGDLVEICRAERSVEDK